MKKVYKYAGIAAISVFVLAAVSFYYSIQTPQIQRIVQSKISSRLNGTVTWDSFRFSAVSRTATIKNILLKDASAEIVASVEKIYVKVSPSDIFTGAITVDDIRIDKPTIRIRADSEGNVNLADVFAGSESAPKSEKTGFPFNISVSHFQISDGAVEFQSDAGNISAGVKNLTVTAHGNLKDQSGSLKITVPEAHFQSDKLQTQLSAPLILDIALTEGGINPISLTAAAPPAELALSGMIRHLFTDPDLNLTLAVKANLQEMRSALGIEKPLSGTADVSATISGPLSAPVIAARVTGENGNIFGAVFDTIFLDAEFENNALVLKRIEAETPYAGMAVHGRFDMAEAFSEKTGSEKKLPDLLKKITCDLDITLQADLAGVRSAASLPSEWSGIAENRFRLSGNLNNPKLSAYLNYRGGHIAGYQIDRIAFEGHLDDRILTVKQLTADAGSGKAALTGNIDFKTAFQEGFIGSSYDLNTISYTLSMTGDQFSLTALSGNNHPIRGSLSGDMRLAGKGISLSRLSGTFSADVIGRNLSLRQEGAPVNLTLSADAAISQRTVSLKKLIADIVNPKSPSTAFLRLDASGNADIGAETFAAQIHLKAPDLKSALLPVGVSDVCGSLSLDGILSGSFKRPAFKGTADGKQLCFRDIQFGNLNLDAELTPSGALTISKLAIENSGSKISAKGTMQVFDPKDASDRLDITFQKVGLKDFFKKDTADGFFDGTLMLRGNLSDLKAEADIRGKHLAFASFRIGNADLKMRLDGGNLTIDSASVANRRSKITLKGSAAVFAPGTTDIIKNPVFNLTAEPSSVFIEDFTDTAKGKITLEGHFGGTPESPEGTLRIRAANIDTDAQKIREADIDLRLEDQKLFFKPVVVRFAPGESVTGEGWISLHKEFQFKLASEGVSLNRIDAVNKQKHVRGIVAADVSGQGSFQDPQVTGSLYLKNLTLNEKPIDDFKISAVLQNHRVQISGKLNFDISGWLDLPSYEFSGAAAFQQTDLSPYFAMLSQPAFTGDVTGAVRVSGNIKDMSRIQGNADLSRIQIRFNGDDVLSSENFIASLQSGAVAIPENAMKLLKDGTLKLNGTGTLQKLNLNLSADIPLKAASIFAKELSDVTGRIAMTAGASGDFGKPDVSAAIQMTDIGMTIPATRQKLHGVSGQITVSSKTVDLKELTGMIDSGRFNISGTLDHSNFVPSEINLKAAANSLPIQIPDTLDVLFNADVRVTGTPDKSLAKGDIIILDGLYDKEITLNLSNLIKKKRTTAPTSPPKNYPFLKHMNLDISVRHRNPFLIRNKLANLDLKSDLKITGDYHTPIITGRANIEAGTIVYEKKELTVRKGGVDFVNPYRTEAFIDIESEIKIRKWDITLTISGPPEEISIELTSKPPESHGDIMSLIVFGRTTRELIEREGGSAQSPSQMVGEIIANTIGEHIRKKTGIDVLEVEMYQDNNGTEASDRVKVTMGKELSRRMTLKYVMDSVDGEITNKAVAEYKFLENIMLSGFQDSKGGFGGELRFRLEFR